MLKEKKFWFGVIISIIIIIILLYSIDFRDAYRALKNTNYLYIIPAMLIFLLSFFFRSLRWRYVLYPIKRMPLYNLFKATMIGFMANFVLPARIGELIRGYVIANDQKISRSSGVASVVVSRLLDALILMILWIGLLLVLGWKKSESMWMIGAIGIGAYVGLGILLLIFYKKNERIADFLSGLVARFSKRYAVKVRSGIHSFKKGMLLFRNPGHFIKAFFYSLVIWGLSILSTWFVIAGFGFEESVPAYTPFVVVALLTLAIAIPSSPGFWGTFEVSGVFAIRICNSSIPNGEALSFTFLLHMSQLIPIVSVGFLFLWLGNLRLDKLAKEGEELQPEVE